MEYRDLGTTGLRVSELCLGTWQMSGVWGKDYQPAIKAVERAFDLGVNFFDTAHAYGEGAAEAGLARGLGDLLDSHRDEIVISTKGGVEMESGRAKARNSDPAFLRENLEHSLRTLGTDFVDIYLIHWPDPTVPFETTAGVLEDFVKEGLVRHAGVSNFTVEQMEAFSSGGKLSVTQVPYNLLRREIENDILPYCERQGVGVMGWASLAHGLLTGALRRDIEFAEDDWRSSNSVFQGDSYVSLLDAVESLSRVAQERDCTLAQLAIAWVLASPFGVIPVIGAEVPEHIEASASASEIKLTEAEVGTISDIIASAPSADMGFGPPSRNSSST